MPHVIFFIFFLSWGTKTATVAKHRGLFCSFFFMVQNHNFGKVRGLKLQLSLILIIMLISVDWIFFNKICFSLWCALDSETRVMCGVGCLHWFLVNNRWFKNSYLQDQRVNLKDILCFLFSRNSWLFFNNVRGLWR